MRYKNLEQVQIQLLFFVFVSIALTMSANGQNRKKIKINRVVMSHALEQSPTGLWYPLVAKMAKDRRLFSVIPQLPDPQAPRLKSWQETITSLANQSPESTILIGHSLGGITLLRFLDSYNKKEKFPLLILVAPTVFDVGYEALKEFFQKPLQFSSLKNKVEKIVVIISPTDPVLKPDPLQHGLLLLNEVDAKLVVVKKGNHFWQGDDFSDLEEAIRSEIDAVLKEHSQSAFTSSR